MSTCPNKDLYSVYIDDELPSPWKEKLEAHLKDCSKCREVVSSYRILRLKIEEAKIPALDMDGSFLKLYAKRMELLDKAELGEKNLSAEKPHGSWFTKSVKIPIPAIAAAALFLFVFTPILIVNTKKSVEYVEVSPSNFKPLVPVSNINAAKPKKITFTNLDAFGIKNDSISTNVKKTNINFNNFINLYLTPATMNTTENAVIRIPKIDISILNNTQEFNLTFAKNEQ